MTFQCGYAKYGFAFPSRRGNCICLLFLPSIGINEAERELVSKFRKYLHRTWLIGYEEWVRMDYGLWILWI